MKRVILLTSLLILGLISSQFLPWIWGPLPTELNFIRGALTMGLLAYIMIEVGREFEIDLGKKKEYAVDYGVAATAAAFPWIFCTIYFLIFLMPDSPTSDRAPWIEAMLAARFAAPTSAGVLFSMLAAAGLAGTWAFRKTRILAIFDDLDTVLFMIPLKIVMVGFAWQMGVDLFVVTLLLVLGWKYYRKLVIPSTWPWVLLYAFVITCASELIFFLTKEPDSVLGVHIEVLLPAFVLGCALKHQDHEDIPTPGEEIPGEGAEERAGLVISCLFMLLVGLSMPSMFGSGSVVKIDMGWGEILLHVLAVTVLSNLGKMFAAFCYRKEATLRERLAVSVSLFPRGEVGAGVLAVSLSYGITGPFVTIGFLSLALNLMLTGVFIVIVKRLL
ncbi:sodium:proton antiporter [Bdellovibrio sp. HCB288]|uniref:sodium:proton antiporter n=1 Tax=Bdellovibrio sp. HCB288 TaxID=3394355 RepID=UPI0039B500B8